MFINVRRFVISRIKVISLSELFRECVQLNSRSVTKIVLTAYSMHAKRIIANTISRMIRFSLRRLFELFLSDKAFLKSLRLDLKAPIPELEVLFVDESSNDFTEL